jgi:hypothetical protein
MEICDKCGPGTEAHVSFMTPQGAITLCHHHARKFGTALRAYPSALMGGDVGVRTASGTRARPAWRGVMWPPE